MRASSLSNPRVIDLLNKHFVCVHLRNQDFDEDGSAGEAEKKEKLRIYRAAVQAGLPAGTVCIYLLAPDGKPLDTAPLNRPDATNPERLAEKLSRVLRDLHVAPGEPLVAPQPADRRIESAPDDLVLHLTARYLERKGDDLVRIDTGSVLGSKKGGNWADLPSEDWIVWSRPEWTKLLPPGSAQEGTEWELDRETISDLLGRFFPPTENTDLATNRIDEQSLTARVESVTDGKVRARLEGRLKIKHPFYHRDDEHFVETRLVGYMLLDLSRELPPVLRLVTDSATYGADPKTARPFGVAIRSR